LLDRARSGSYALTFRSMFYPSQLVVMTHPDQVGTDLLPARAAATKLRWIRSFRSSAAMTWAWLRRELNEA
jgi:hypothetical protein